jgi:ribonuclease-3
MRQPLLETERLEQRLGVQVRDPALLALALIHASALNEWPDELPGDNERLEFLGDAVLGAAVADALYRTFPDEPEGSLTFMRATLVRESALARWARRLDLGAHLTLGRGEERRGGRDRSSILAGCFEAVLGAIYLDQGYERVCAIVAPLVAEAVAGGVDAEPLRPSSRAPDAKSELQRQSQTRYGELPAYHVLAIEGPEHGPSFRVEVRVADRITVEGTGRSKQAAEQDAAARALQALLEDEALGGEA